MVNPLTFEETTWGEKPPPLHFFSAVPWLFLRHWFPESKRLWMYCECIVMVCPAACPIPSDKFLQFRAPTLWSKTRFMRDKDIAYHSEIIPFYFSRLCDVYLKSLFGSAGWLSVMPLLFSFVVFGICGCTILCLYYESAQMPGVSMCSSETLTPFPLQLNDWAVHFCWWFVDDLFIAMDAILNQCHCSRCQRRAWCNKHVKLEHSGISRSWTGIRCLTLQWLDRIY